MAGPADLEDFEDLFETAPCGYLSLAPDGRIVKANRTLAGWLGRAPDTLPGQPIHEILGFGGKIAFETHLAPLLRMQGHVHEIALDLAHADGGRIPTIANAAEKRDAEGRHLFTRVTLFRAVERRAYERSLLEGRAAAEEESQTHREASLLRDQFIAVLGHDLRNPLAAIRAGIDLMMRREQPSERGRLILSEMDNSIGRAWSLIDDVLDLARGHLGDGLPVERDTRVPLAPALQHVVAEIRSIAPTRTIDARIAIEEPVACDPGRIGQLASNLLSNAATHGAAGTPIRFDAATQGDRFVLTVANAGEPIPEDALGHLFQPFFRGAARASQQGLGLGLYIASEIARAHDGTLEVSSTAEETRFTFAMPRAAAARR